jgi:uncharacterized membrane protein YeaQ/YmgE (transglycosylase-associated protein family)
MALLTWLIFGAMAGSISYLIAPEKGIAEFFQVFILSIMGAVLGGIMANLLLGASITTLNLGSLILAAAGSTILIIIPKIYSRHL